MTSSQNRERHGLIFYDGQHPLDKAHVRACAEVTKAVTVSIPYAGHPVGETLNRSYKLKKLLAEVAALVERGDHPSSAAWASYAAEVAAAHHCSDIHTFNTSTDFETMAHHYSLGRPFRVSIDAAEHFFSKLHRASYPICGVLLGMQILSENTGSLKRNPARLKRIASEFETGLHRRGYRIPVGLQKQLDNVSAGKPI